MTLLGRFTALLDATTTPLVANAHCDLPCGVYDPAQARIEAQSVKACMEKYNASDDADFKVRATIIKEERCRPREAPPVGAVDRLLQGGPPEGVPEPARPLLDGHQDRGRREKEQRREHRRPAPRVRSHAIAEIFWATKK